MRISRQGVGEQVAPRTRGSPPGVVAGGGGEQVASSDVELARQRPVPSDEPLVSMYLAKQC